MTFQFPKGFLWGAATSSHQVEGGNMNDWSEWEKKNAERLAREAENKFGHLPNWPDIKAQAQNPQNYISGRACDHYNRYEEDFDIAKLLGHNAHRFSIEWSRIEPEEGKWDEREIEHYRKVITALRAHGMEPFVTLWHWTNPLWISDIGGWENKETIKYFLRYVKKVFDEYGELVKFWMPVNEPGTQVSLGYIFGSQPPGKKSKVLANKVFKNLMQAQKEVFLLNKKEKYGFQIGSSHFMYFCSPYKKLLWNWIAAKIMNHVMDARFFNVFKKYSDFLGIQYYQPFFVNLKIGGRVVGLIENKETKEWTNDLGWEIFPEGIYHVVKKAAKYKKPIFITENGLPNAKDIHRRKFIIEHLRWLHKAINEGVDIKGYFHWSLIDNFEMPEVRGFWPRFGLVEIDYKTMERKIRPSALEYAEICKTNQLH